MAKKAPPNGPPTVHVAGVSPSTPAKGPDPCRHGRNKKNKGKVWVVYKAPELKNGKPTGRWYIGRTSGTSSAQARNKRQATHHRKDIGNLVVICVQDSYSACRGAEQKHYDALGPSKQINAPRKKGRGKQIAPIRAKNKKRKDYLACAKDEGSKKSPACGACST